MMMMIDAVNRGKGIMLVIFLVGNAEELCPRAGEGMWRNSLC